VAYRRGGPAELVQSGLTAGCWCPLTTARPWPGRRGRPSNFNRYDGRRWVAAALLPGGVAARIEALLERGPVGSGRLISCCVALRPSAGFRPPPSFPRSGGPPARNAAGSAAESFLAIWVSHCSSGSSGATAWVDETPPLFAGSAAAMGGWSGNGLTPWSNACPATTSRRCGLLADALVYALLARKQWNRS